MPNIPAKPLFIATDTFGPADGEKWQKYIDWSGLRQLDELVSLDGLLCPSVLPEVKDSYWPHILAEDFCLNFFTDLNFLKSQIVDIPRHRLLCVLRNPNGVASLPSELAEFEFVGFDLLDRPYNATSALCNCRGFPGAFAPNELSSSGLLRDGARAIQVQRDLQRLFPDDPHANCDIWAIFQAAA